MSVISKILGCTSSKQRSHAKTYKKHRETGSILDRKRTTKRRILTEKKLDELAPRDSLYNFQVIVIIVILLAVRRLDARLLPPEFTDLEEHLSDCILNISTTYLRTDLPLLVQTPDTWYERLQGMEEFHEKRNHGNKIIQALQNSGSVPLAMRGDVEKFEYKHNTNPMKPGSYLLILIGMRRNTLRMNALMFRRMMMNWNFRARVVILTDNQLRRIVGKLLYMAYRLGYAEAISVNHLNNHVVEVAGWLPEHQNELCEFHPPKFRLMDTWNCEKRRFKKNNNLFPRKRLVDIKNCKLIAKASMGNIHGVPMTGVLLKIFLQDDMFRFVDIKSPIKSHIGFPAEFTDPRFIYECFATYPHIRDELRWYVHPGTTVPRWLALFKVFSPNLWILATFTFIMGTVVSYLLTMQRSFTKAAMNALLSHLVMGAEVKLVGVIAAPFFILWLFYCLHINTGYQAALFGFLVNPGQVPTIQTLEELQNSGLKLYIEEQLSEFLGNKYDNLMKCKDSCVSLMFSEKDRALLSFSIRIDALSARRRDPDGKPYMVPLKENSDTMYFSVVISEHILRCLVHDHIEEMITRYVEAGELESMNRFVYGLGDMWNVNETITDVSSLSLSHLEGAFFVLLYGLLAAVLVFLGEVLFNKIVVTLAGILLHFTRPI